MSSSSRSRRTGAVIGVASLAALALTGIATAGSAVAASTTNPYSPAAGHPYRHGVTPTIGVQKKMNAYAKSHPNTVTATGPQTLSYGGGIDGIGVQSGHSKTYLVFYGTQWGTSSTDANGNLKFTGDSAGAAGAAQQMFKGIGTNNELWSADLTQWCDGAGVATGATACPASGASYVPYQTGGVLAGVWYDNSAASPSAATAAQLGQEAVSAAAHFGNTTAASNRYAYYVILSPHGTNPDNYQGQYCAWHDWNGDVGVSSPYGDLAFSNQPYNIDSGAGCGVGFVNSPGTLDGWTMTLGHEWHEMMSDQNPAGGWTNHTGSSYNGQENSDECAWLSPGTAGGATNVSFGSFGTYAEQASWSNDTNNCAISHPIVNHGGTGSGNLAVNGGFESGAGSWSVWPGSNFVAYQSGQVPGEAARTGQYYGATNTGQSGGGIYQDVPVTAVAGNVYCASAWVRTQYPSTGAAGTFVLWLMGGSSTENGAVNFSGLGNAGNWRQVQTCVSATTGHTQLRIQFYPAVNGPTLEVDDVDAHASMAVNGGFESGAGSWSVWPSSNFVAYQSGQVPGEAARTGQYYGATNTGQSGGGIYQDVPVTAVAGNVYCASAWVRTQYPSTGAAGTFVLWLMGGSSTENGAVNFSGLGNAGNWRQVQTCVSATTGHTQLRIQFYPAVNGPTLEVDDVDVH